MYRIFGNIRPNQSVMFVPLTQPSKVTVLCPIGLLLWSIHPSYLFATMNLVHILSISLVWTANVVSGFTSPSVVSRGPSPTRLYSASERTYIMIKPDGVQRGLVGSIVGRFETKGYKLVAMKTKQADKELLEKHYSDLVEKPFFPKLRDYMLSGPVSVLECRDCCQWGSR